MIPDSRSSTPTFLTRADAVRAISDRIADRDAFLITVPPGLVGDVADRLQMIASWSALIDNGSPLVLRTEQSAVLKVCGLLGPLAVVLVVPKIVAAARLSRALRHDLPGDGSRDMILLRASEDGPQAWPTLFVDALDVVDPLVAAQIRAAEIGAPEPSGHWTPS